MNSIILIQDQMLKDSLPLLAEKRREEQENNLIDGEDSQLSGFEAKSKKGSLEERITILSIAYHNLAVELEFLNQVSWIPPDFNFSKHTNQFSMIRVSKSTTKHTNSRVPT